VKKSSLPRLLLLSSKRNVVFVPEMVSAVDFDPGDAAGLNATKARLLMSEQERRKGKRQGHAGRERERTRPRKREREVRQRERERERERETKRARVYDDRVGIATHQS